MKRLIFVVPVICMISACGAVTGGAPPAPDLDVPFSAEAEISYGGSDCTAQIRRMEAGKWEFCITAPYPVEGLIITVNGDSTGMKMYDMESFADVNGDAVSMARAIVTAYDAAARNSDTSYDGAALTLSGSSELGAYSLTFSEDGTPDLFSADAGHLSAHITKFVPLERAGQDEDVYAEIVE